MVRLSSTSGQASQLLVIQSATDAPSKRRIHPSFFSSGVNSLSAAPAAEVNATAAITIQIHLCLISALLTRSFLLWIPIHCLALPKCSHAQPDPDHGCRAKFRVTVEGTAAANHVDEVTPSMSRPFCSAKRTSVYPSFFSLNSEAKSPLTRSVGLPPRANFLYFA